MRVQLKSFILLLMIVLQQHVTVIRAAEQGVEEFEFQTEVGRLMDIIINSLYTQKEIFLRELISNSSDALDKLRFLSVKDPKLTEDFKNLEIYVDFDAEKKTISITDTGIGMTKQDLIQNLGTIAKSGTTNFIEAIKGGNVNIIGQFGVGFYSSFLVAQKVQVSSKHPEDEQWVWESSAANSFHVFKETEQLLQRGTRVTLFLKQDAQEFLDEKKLGELIKRHSEFINFPINLRHFKEVEKEVVDEEAEAKRAEEKAAKTDEEINEETDEKPIMKKIKEKVPEWKVMNDNKAIWTRPKEEISDEDYVQFYKSFSKDYEDPLNWIHFKGEGEVEFTSLLYCPKKAPHDLFENYYGKSAALKLYVRRVLINEEFEELMPRYLNFIRGVVDSDDLPLNVNRESIQQVKMLKVMSRKLVRKALDMIKKMADEEGGDDSEDEDDSEESHEEEVKQKEPKEGEQHSEDDDDEKGEDKEKLTQERRDRYKAFWKEFGKNIKLGIIEDSSNRNKLAKLTRWYSSHNSTELTSFDQYISRAKENQDSIYFLAGETKEIILNHPTIQKLLKKGYEVLLLDDPIDEFTFQNLNEYEKKKLVNVGKGNFKFPEDNETERKRNKAVKKAFEPLTSWWKKLLTNDLDEVRISQRLHDDPCVIVSSEHGYSAQMERISKAQAYANQDRSNPAANQKKILEINPNHPAIKELLERVKEDPDSQTEEIANVLYEGALVNSGYSLKDPAGFAKKFYRLLNNALGIPKDAPIEEYEVDIEDDEEEAKSDSQTQSDENVDIDDNGNDQQEVKDDL
ncbi:heat shock protein HSP90 (macronuclear) [Tetrahymena thermophila SB210]|uniref:Heat shock protein HSP90 n=1 Tax=Tetrahymena thermophila (strain SB210) TaxID=312017 RepID=I7M3G1_TETTS|nr:heat shock protein HSP90 [Tetrahymena thermophila SB210]EAS03085.1 heat shock protein HSP90 [Tetrahymena thermophila SB210]|eukprot:XP_001023330.1 heat shock protein HSP90 [Tetrahymena thermophila SB210]